MAIKSDKVEKWRLLGQTVPQVEITGPYANQYNLLIQDIDGDYISLKPLEAKRLIKRLQRGLELIAEQREKRYPKQHKIKVVKGG